MLGDEKGGWSKARGKFLNSCLFHLMKMPFLMWRGHFCSSAEKGRGVDPQDLPSCVPVILYLQMYKKAMFFIFDVKQNAIV